MVSLAQSNWNPWVLMPQIVTIIVTTIIIVTVSFLYQHKVKKMQPEDDPRGLVLIVELIIKNIEKLVVSVLGVKYKNLTIYAMYLMLYILLGNWISIIGLDSQSSSYTVTLSMALVTFIGIYYVAIKFQKLLFFKKFIINPLDLIMQFAPLISLSFRLFGNIMGGSIIISLLYALTGAIWANVPVIGQVNLLIGTVGPLIHIYFDLFTGSIQALIFLTLTLVYWQMQMDEGSHRNKSELEIKIPRKLRKQRKIQQKLKNSNDLAYSERTILDQKIK